MAEATILAYLAGMIDADGYITIQRSAHAGRRYYGAKIGIAGTRREPHDLAASLWGGSVGRYVPANTRHRPQFQWTRSGEAAVIAIAAIQPYLLIKADNARVALQLHDHMIEGRHDDPFPWFPPDYDPSDHREYLVAEMRLLNQSRARAREHMEYPR